MLTIQNLSKRFGKKQVLNDISFNAKKGEVTALIGVNGIGKTTIMNCIAGLLPFDKGKISIDDILNIINFMRCNQYTTSIE